MLVYANQLRLRGSAAEAAVFRAVGGWLKEQLGFGLHPDQLKQDGEYTGTRATQRSWLRIYACYEGEPAMCAWVLKHSDREVRGRQWIVELGFKRSETALEVSCVVRTDDLSTLVSKLPSASQPRVIRYIVSNVLGSRDADFVDALPGEFVKSIGEDRDSYRAFLAEIERPERDGALVLLSATREGEYLVNPDLLQRTLVGLADVVQVKPGSNSYEMEEVLGRSRSAWDGAITILSIPSAGSVRSRYFLSDEIETWGDERQRISQILARVTANTNVPRLRNHVRPRGVEMLAVRRRAQARLAQIARMSVNELRRELADQKAVHETALQEQKEEHDSLLAAFSDDYERVQNESARYEEEAKARDAEVREKDFQLQSLRAAMAGGTQPRDTNFDAEPLVKLIARTEAPSPLECIELIEQLYGGTSIVLDSAKTSARKASGFRRGRYLLDLLLRLVTSYRSALLEGGDSKARLVFGRNEYAAKESETVMNSSSLARYRTFRYDGTDVKMFQHLKIGAADDPTQTIRVHFHWDSDRELIVLGHCGEHLPVPSH